MKQPADAFSDSRRMRSPWLLVFAASTLAASQPQARGRLVPLVGLTDSPRTGCEGLCYRPGLFTRVGRIDEQQDHHPDLHLTGYRNVAIELSTHDMNGLTEQDFVVATMIEKLPVELKKLNRRGSIGRN
jgi:hypothetical protein